MIDDQGQVALALAVGDLVDTDPFESGQSIGAGGGSVDDPADDGGSSKLDGVEVSAVAAGGGGTGA
ncbi:hypothetical protein JD77_05883 [Micromonospora olivasterospora]|uniref:Uncharacterized protein n=1 Tax=Micromonospora olivasterospora TaxID=1880 RepID=A0A562IJ17_MICOL|nr:hypothetical protein JD77_05883 [Micromonospora olivasterospora]